MPRDPRDLEVIGPYRGTSGYDRHTRAFVRAMTHLGMRIRLHMLHGWSADLAESLRDPFFDNLREPVDARSVLHFTMPTQAQRWPAKRNINYTMFEADRIPHAWVQRAHDHDCIVVPCQPSLKAWLNADINPRKMRVCPLGVDGEFLSRPSPALPLSTEHCRPLSSYSHRFLNIAQARPRKNHLGLIRTWLRATAPHDDAVLVIKIGASESEFQGPFRRDLERMMQRHNLSLDRAAPILFLRATLSEPEIRSLYHSCTHYISMSFGEGWDMVTMEAASAGLHLIVPTHTAYLEYLTVNDAAWIPASPALVQFEGTLGAEDWTFFGGLHWWQPDEDTAVETVRAIVGGASSDPPPSNRIIRTYSWENAARKLIEILTEQEEDSCPPTFASATQTRLPEFLSP